jgi:hypothetical protein
LIAVDAGHLAGIHSLAPGSGVEQGECLGDVGVVSGGDVPCGEREVVAGCDADSVDELVAGAELVLGRQAELAAVVQP